MKVITNNIKPVLLSAFMLGLSVSAHAKDENVCAPFKDADIDQGILSLMLQAATDGDLYRIKPGSSKMGFCVNGPTGEVKAEFRKFNGGLALNDVERQGASLVHIEVDSLETDSGFIEMMMKSESFFDSEQYPDIIFASTGIEWTTDKKGILKGDLTMHGVTKAVAFYVELKKTETEPGKEAVTVKATTTVQRSEFGMFTLSPMVDDRVSLCMSIDAYRHQS
ncbi:MAG: YceI family protein [Gammaproteobacteria bacterium]